MFKRELRQLDIWALAVGSIIGWGCFVMPGINFLPKGGPLGSIIGLMLGALIICIISASYSFMIRRHPYAGGEFIYVTETFGGRHAFVCGWMIVLAYWSLIPLNATAISLVSRYILPAILPGSTSPFMFGYMYSIAGWDVYFGEILLAWAFIILIGLLNIYSVKSFGRFQSVVALLMTASVLVVVIGVIVNKPDVSNMLPAFGNVDLETGVFTESGIIPCIFAVLAYTPYCFVGFDSIPQAAEEYSFSHKKTFRIMIGAIVAGGLIYAAIVFVTAVVAPWRETVASGYSWPTGEMIMRVLGTPGLVFIGIAMLCAVISGINGFYMAGSRLMNSMAEKGALPKGLGGLSKRGTPVYAIVFLMILSLIAPFFGRSVLSWIVDMTCVGAAIGFVYTCACAFKIGRSEKLKGRTVSSFVGICVSLIFLVETFIPGMPGFLSVPSWIILAVWVVLGIIFFPKKKRPT